VFRFRPKGVDENCTPQARRSLPQKAKQPPFVMKVKFKG